MTLPIRVDLCSPAVSSPLDFILCVLGEPSCLCGVCLSAFRGYIWTHSSRGRAGWLWDGYRADVRGCVEWMCSVVVTLFRGSVMPGFLPRREADLLHWSVNFERRLSTEPERFGLSAADTAGFAAVQRALSQAFRRAVEPATRTSGAVLEKNTARDAMMAAARSLANRVRAWPGRTNEALAGDAVRKGDGSAAQAQRRGAGDADDHESFENTHCDALDTSEGQFELP